MDRNINDLMKVGNYMYNKTLEEQKQVKKLQKLMVSTVFIVILALVLNPIICFVSGYLGGMILKASVGEALVKGINYVLNTDRFSKEMIPYICGALATFGSYFRTITRSNKE